MKQRPSVTVKLPLRTEQTADSTQPVGPPGTVRSRFAIRLPLHSERGHIPPSNEQDSPASRLFYTFLDILSGISHEVPAMAESGLLAFDVEAAYPGIPPGVIPDDEVQVLSVLLREKLPGVIREAAAKARAIIETSPTKRGLLKVTVQFPRIAPTHRKQVIINEQLQVISNESFVDDASRRKTRVPLADESSAHKASERLADELRRRGFVEESPSALRGDRVEEITDDTNKELMYDDSLDTKHGQGGPAALADDKYAQLIRQLEQRNHAFRQQLAAELAPALNKKIQAKSSKTYEQKKELARWVSEELRRFDLAIKGPSGEPSVLVAIAGNPPEVEVGRLMLEHKSSEGKRIRIQLPATLPSFELIAANPRREALREWRDKIGPQRSGASRP